jgi:predicted nucleic acid-binding Zn ribbon protein
MKIVHPAKDCVTCGSAFIPGRVYAIYCSAACKLAGQLAIRRSRACGANGCHRGYSSRGYCVPHLKDIDAGRPLHKSVVHLAPGTWSRWKKNHQGYMYRVKTENTVQTRQLQHRWIMEQHLGRELLKHENIHHINGDRADNRIENLEIWSVSQPKGQRVADKVAWAKEILSLYGGMVDGPEDDD